MPPSTIPPIVGEGGQPAGEVGPVTGEAEVAPSAPSSILAKRKQDDNSGVSGHKKSRAPLSHCALRPAAAPPSPVLAAASPSSFAHPHVSLDHLYTSNDVDSLWGANYKL